MQCTVGTKPSKNNNEETVDSFKTGSDGKMIIVDDDDDLLTDQSTDSEGTVSGFYLGIFVWGEAISHTITRGKGGKLEVFWGEAS